MKKLVYILSLAIGLLMTGCAQWENFESLSPDTWGAEPELTVTAPDSITTEVITFTIAAKNATNLAYVVYDQAVDMDYTLLLQGLYNGCRGGEIEAEGFEQTFSMKGAVPGNTYYLYVVVANEAGVQATYEKAMGAHDLDAPFLTSDPALTASNKGTRVTLTFNEAIVRTDAMGAITFDIYNEDLEVVREGVATAVASSNQLTVTLPADVTFEAVSYVLLSFEEGAVEDKYGNKMAAINNFLEDGLPNGPWWMVDPNKSDIPTEGFLREGVSYAWYGVSTAFTQDGSETEVGSDIFNVTFEQGDVDLTEYFGSPLTAQKWSMPSIMGILNNATVANVPCYVYEAPANNGDIYTWATFFDPTADQGLMVAGTYDLSAAGLSSQQECYMVSYDPQSGKISITWDFVVDNMNGKDVMVNAGYKAAVMFIADMGEGESPYILFDFEDIYLLDESMLGAAKVNYYEQPIRLEMSAIEKGFARQLHFVEK